jgi:hypothetical protein
VAVFAVTALNLEALLTGFYTIVSLVARKLLSSNSNFVVTLTQQKQ